MYCGCNEKALTSQRAIACALLELMEHAPYADISISALCRAAGISRPTFYSLFGSKDDVVSYILRESHCYAPEPEAGSCLRSFCLSYSRYITRQRHFLTLLVNNGVGHLLYQSIFDSLMDCGCFLQAARTTSKEKPARTRSCAGFWKAYSAGRCSGNYFAAFFKALSTSSCTGRRVWRGQVFS